jgi:hypothetical protein
VPECIQERCRTQGGSVVVEIWHVVAGPSDKEATWRPIRCGGGIFMPGNSQRREPSCSECTALTSRETGDTK